MSFAPNVYQLDASFHAMFNISWINHGVANLIINHYCNMHAKNKDK